MCDDRMIKNMNMTFPVESPFKFAHLQSNDFTGSFGEYLHRRTGHSGYLLMYVLYSVLIKVNSLVIN